MPGRPFGAGDSDNVIVVGAGVDDSKPDDETSDSTSVADMVEQPAKVMRIGTMIKQLLEEVRAAPLDDASRNRLREIHQSSIRELEDGLAPELREELERLALPFSDDQTPSDAELRIAQAQLVGWLEGLFHGIQTALFAPADGRPRTARADASGCPAPPGHAGTRRSAQQQPRAISLRPVPLNRSTPVAGTLTPRVSGSRRRRDSRASRQFRVPHLRARCQGPPRRSRQPGTVVPSGLAGHQAALSSLGARSALDRNRDRRHRDRDGSALRRAVRHGHQGVPAVRRTRSSSGISSRARSSTARRSSPRTRD